MAHTNFGKGPDGNPYTIELGANWVLIHVLFGSVYGC
jgi:hypothetical protein